MAADPAAPNPHPVSRYLPLLVLFIAILSGCSRPAPAPSPPTGSATAAPETTSNSPTTAPAELIPEEIPHEHAAAIIDFVDGLNETAGGSVADQQRFLLARMTAGSVKDQQGCPSSTTTIRILPAWSSAMPDPEFTPPNQSGSDPPYRLPVLVEIFAGSRKIGTDLTLFHFQIHGDRALTFPLCLN